MQVLHTDTDAARHVFDKRRLGQELAFDAIAARVGATGPLMYPVKSGEEMQTLLGNFMRRGAGDEYTCGMVYYLLKDVENEWSSDFAHTVGMVEGFRRVLDGLWCLDHGDLETAVMYLNTPGATNPFQNAFKIMQALMHACEPELAAKYMKGSGAASLSVQDMRGYEMKILLEKGCLLEAFLFQREDSECGEFGLLGTLLQHTFNMNKSADLIHLPLTDAEEAQLVSFCQTHASQGHGICVNFLLKYYMARGRVAEAVYTYDAVPDADWNHDGVTDVIENLRMTLPGDQRELLRKAVKAPVEKFVQPEVQAPVLISTMLDQCIGSVAKEDSVVGGDHTPVIAPADLRSSTPFSGLATASQNSSESNTQVHGIPARIGYSPCRRR
ncbi:nuclear pore complex assembly-domain-containing protein [Chytriomyces sp. MP71]|nr:nuclear pore complex assembly-domain-containing protein [Chytriomyces sp. MP71]